MVKALLAYKTHGTNEVPTVLYAGSDHDAMMREAAKVTEADGLTRLEWIQINRGIPLPLPHGPTQAHEAGLKAAQEAADKAAVEAKAEADKAQAEVEAAAKKAADEAEAKRVAEEKITNERLKAERKAAQKNNPAKK